MGIGRCVHGCHAVQRVCLLHGYGAMRVVCRVPWQVERDAGHMLLPGESEAEGKARIAREAVGRDIRPCGLYHCWVVKKTCGAKCNGFVRRIEEEKEDSR